MNITSKTKVGEVVKLNFKTAQLFQASKIDYCCGGEKAISEACEEVGINPVQLLKNIEEVVAQNDPDSEYINNLTLNDLTEYIVKRHHSYVSKTIPFLKNNLDKLCNVHGSHHSELFTIKELFYESAGNLTMHMQKEELILFPYIKHLETAKNNNMTAPSAPFGSVKNPIKMMIDEHQNEGNRFEEISKLSENYQIPGDACTTYEVTLNQLRDFENDLHRHIHLENNILFPKAVILEQEFSKQKMYSRP